MGISPRFSNGELTYLPSRIVTVTGNSPVLRYNKQIDYCLVNSAISGASYGLTLDGTEIWYNASGVQTAPDILAGLRLEATTVAGNIAYATVVSGAPYQLQFIASGVNQGLTTSNLSARLSVAILTPNQDASGVTMYSSPFAVVAASNAWYRMVAPINAAKLRINSAVALRVGTDTGASNGFTIAANVDTELPASDGNTIILHAAAAGNVSFMYETFEPV